MAVGATSKKHEIELPEDPALRALIVALMAENESLKQRVIELERMCFGPRSEKILAAFDVFQQDLLPFPEFLAERERARAAEEAAKTEETVTVGEHKRKKRGRRSEFPDDLPRHRIEYPIAEQRRLCCGQELRTIGWDVSSELERIEFCFVKDHACEKGVCDACGTIRVAERPPRVFERSLLGPHFLARVIYERFGNHMPYARLERKYLDEGLELSRSVLCSSVLRCAELLEPVYEALRRDVLDSDLVQSDDTEVVQRNGQQKGRKKVNLWVYRADGHGAFFEVTDARSRDGPRGTLKGFSGLLQCDGHDCFDAVGDDITRVGCWAHARRKFITAVKGGDDLAQTPLALIRKIFRVEKRVKAECETPAQRVAVRQADSAPTLELLHSWLEEQRATPPRAPKSPLMKAVGYALNQWPTLERFVDDGRIVDITNNAAERALRGPVLGRKNWLFFGNEEGARRGAILMSLVQSCKELRINPLLYIADVLNSLSDTPASEVATLTPRGWQARAAGKNLAPALSPAEAIL